MGQTANEGVGDSFREEKIGTIEFLFSLISKLNQCFMLNSTHLQLCPFLLKSPFLGGSGREKPIKQHAGRRDAGKVATGPVAGGASLQGH